MAPATLTRRPLLLIILDGWGYREESESNAINGNAPFFKECLERFPNTLLTASGREVGLPDGLMGNSEVGHLNLGSGQVVYQDVSRIDKSIEDGSIRENPAITAAMELAVEQGKQLHLIGLVSDGGVHSSNRHLRHLLKLAAERGVPAERVLIHAITDGRDTPPRSALDYLTQLEQDVADAGVGRIASVIGRYFAMDRDKRWERVQKAYECLVAGTGTAVSSALEGARASYSKDIGDEFFEPMIVGEASGGRIQDGDAVLCFNFRSDRMRELCECLTFDGFDGFERSMRVSPMVTTLTQYRADFPYPVAYPPIELEGILGEVLSQAGLRQERIAETEKYAHVTFFFNGGKEAEFSGESRTLIPSPKVATYDLQPEMSAPEVTQAVLASLDRAETDVYIINFANTDMVGHTGNLEAAKKAVAAVDAGLSRIVPAVLAKGGIAMITADHGNAEQLWDPVSNQPHTAHTINPVPIVLCGEGLEGIKLREMGILADVAPTMLDLGGLNKSPEMDGVSLIL